jgi:copper chaperone
LDIRSEVTILLSNEATVISLLNTIKMKKIQFKTNINCGSCVEKVTPFMQKAESVEQWKVDTANKQKILTVEGDAVDEKEVVQAVQDAGFKIERQ